MEKSNSLLLEVNELLNERSLMDVIHGKYKSPKEVQKIYVPTERVLENLTMVNEDVFKSLKKLSPLNVDVQNQEIRVFLNKFFKFTNEQINRMDEETKEKVIANGMKGIQKTIEAGKNNLVHSTYFMFEETYQQERLKMLIEDNIFKPVILEYEFVEQKFLSMFKSALNDMFWVEGIHFIGGLSGERCQQLHFQLTIDLLKRCKELTWHSMREVQRVYIEKFKEGLTEEEKQDYREFAGCPISFNLSPDYDSGETLYKESIHELFIITKNWDRYKEIAKEERIENILACLVKVGKFVSGKLKEGIDITTFTTSNEMVKSMSVLDSLHLVQKHYENK